MIRPRSRFLSALRRSLLALGLVCLWACDKEGNSSLLLSREDEYRVRYTLDSANGAAAGCFTQYLNDRGTLEPVGRVSCPWAEETVLGSGVRARLRAWGNPGPGPIRLTIVINGLPIVARTLAPGGNLVELSFPLP